MKAIFLEPLESSKKKVPKLSFSSAKAHAIPNLSHVVALSTVGEGSLPPPPCLASTIKMGQNSQITK